MALNAPKLIGAIFALLLSVGCHGQTAETPQPVLLFDATPPRADLDADGTDLATVVDAGTSTACDSPVAQPGACTPPLGELDDSATSAWFKGRRVLERPNYEACTETTWGPRAESALVCTAFAPVVFDKAMGNAGPIGGRRDIVVVTARNKRLTELLRLPLDVSAYGTVLFSARYSFAPAAGTFDLEATPEECILALPRAATYWDEEIRQHLRENVTISGPFKAHLIRLTGVQKQADLVRIKLTCDAAGHYVSGVDGRPRKAK